MDKRKLFYVSLAEASQATKNLNLMSHKKYTKLHHLDPKLPANPWTTYIDEWTNWYDFVGIANPHLFYETLEAASVAAISLNISSRAEYLRRYKEDDRLPSEPNNTYKQSWVDWHHFLKREKIKFYETYQLAKYVLLMQNIKNWTQYFAYRKIDPRLPPTPAKFYKYNWTNSNDYFHIPEVYTSIDKASKAAAKLGIKTHREYQIKKGQDPKLPKNPKKKYKEDWIDWKDFFERTKSRYRTLEDAQKAAQKLKIQTGIEYKLKRHLDNALPARPELRFSETWVSWYHFLGKSEPVFYKTIKEAMEATKRLNIVEARQYYKRYREDNLLPSTPYLVYRKDWVSWNDFLQKPKCFTTYAEAKRTARRLGAKTLQEYHLIRKIEPRLPANIYSTYGKEFTTIRDFLGTNPVYYKSYKLARKAVKNLGIETSVEYKSRYIEDPLLPYKPHLIYRNEWQGMPAYLGQSPKIEKLTKWQHMSDTWANEGRNIDSKLRNISVFVEWMIYLEQPEQLLVKDFSFNFNKYCELIESLSESRKKAFHTNCRDFFDWILVNYCSAEDDSGELVPLPGFINPLKSRKLVHLDFLPRPIINGQTNKPVLPFTYIVKARNYLFPDTAVSFSDVAEILTKVYPVDWIPCKKSLVNKSDPNCIFRTTETGQTEIWNPSRAVALFTLLSVPLRGQQILWLDSGEADVMVPYVIGNDIQFKKNDNQLAKFGRQDKGVVRRDNQGNLGMYITTNKTGTQFGGYQIDYIPDNLSKWLIRLREWQSTYNPIKFPMNWTDINLSRKINQAELKHRGSQCFLFRKSKTEVFSVHSTFTRQLAHVLYLIQDDMKLSTKLNGVYSTPFTPHSMRVSLITAYVIDGGVPINVVSKLVGHASVVMTIYYTKIGQNGIRKELKGAEKKIISSQAEKIQEMIKENNIETAKPLLFARDDDYLQNLDSSWPAASYQFSDKGICPKSGLACDSGGINELEPSLKTHVPDGYLGRRNCVRCKYFITGPAFIGGLQALANEISLELNTIAREYLAQESLIKKLENQKFDCESEDIPFTQGADLIKAQCHYEEKAVKLDALICDLLSTTKLVKASLSIMKNSTQIKDKKQLVVNDDAFDLTCELEESEEMLSLVNNICEDALIFSSSSCAKALPIRSQILDKISANIGLKPFLFSLSDEEQLLIGNQYAQLLRERFKTWDRLNKIASHSFGIDDIDDIDATEIACSLSKICTHAQKLRLS